MKLSLSPFCHCVTRKREPSDLEEVFAALAHASRRQILLVLKFHGGRMSCEFLALANPLYQSSDGSGQALMEAILRTDTTYLLQVTTDSPAFANTNCYSSLQVLVGDQVTVCVPAPGNVCFTLRSAATRIVRLGCNRCIPRGHHPVSQSIIARGIRARVGRGRGGAARRQNRWVNTIKCIAAHKI